MIVTPRAPTSVKELINVGTRDEAETPEETLEEFATTSTILEKNSFMKQAGITLIYVVDALEKEAKAHEKVKKLVEERLGKMQSLESKLEKEKAISVGLQQNLNKANEELQQLRKDKESNDRNCSETLKKVEEFKVLHDKSQ